MDDRYVHSHSDGMRSTSIAKTCSIQFWFNVRKRSATNALTSLSLGHRGTSLMNKSIIIIKLDWPSSMQQRNPQFRFEFYFWIDVIEKLTHFPRRFKWDLMRHSYPPRDNAIFLVVVLLLAASILDKTFGWNAGQFVFGETAQYAALSSAMKCRLISAGRRAEVNEAENEWLSPPTGYC